MAEIEDDFMSVLDLVEQTAEQIKPAADESANFWKMYGTRYHGYVDRQVSSDLHSYDEHINFLVNWSTNRWEYMKNFISSYQKGE